MYHDFSKKLRNSEHQGSIKAEVFKMDGEKIDLPVPYINVVKGVSNKMADISNNCYNTILLTFLYMFLFSVSVLLFFPQPPPHPSIVTSESPVYCSIIR